jgi:biofilm PGA synthesis protein PgaA
VRWGADLLPETPAKRFELTDRAIAMLERLIREARAANDRDLITSLESDRVVALRNRERWNDVVDSLAKMRAQSIPIRPYVREAEADSLLALRRPEEARAIYAELTAADPANLNATVGRFYAEVECEDFAAAFATADGLNRPVLAAQARNYAGLDAQAWERIAPVARRGSAAAYVRSAAAAIEMSRGWPRMAHDDIRVASYLAPDDVGIAVALAESYLRRRDLPAARAILARLSADFSGEPSVERLARELREFDSASFELVARARQESGGAIAAPGPGIETVGRVYSAPIQDSFRIFAGAGYATARPPEGDALRNRLGAGVEWRAPDAALEASAWSNGGDVSRSGAAASASWSPNDVWTLGADYERYAWETPLRAILHGITSDGGGVGVGAAWNESRAAWVGLRAHRFTDGNERRQYRIAWAERVAQTPSWSLTLRPEIYGSQNSLRDAPYFNPSRDFALSLALDWQGLIWRRYEQSFRHRITARVGEYRQEGFADGMVGGLAYEQSWQPGTRMELRWGVEFGRARYDGANEKMAILFISASGRF